MFDRKESSKKVLDSYLEKKKQDSTLGCYLATAASLGKNSAKFVVGSSTPVDANTLKSFIFALTKHRLVPFLPTFSQYEDKQHGVFYSSIIANRIKTQTIPVEGNENKMTQINATSFLNQDFSNIWEKKEIEGKSYFVRSNDDDLEKILEDANYMYASATSRSSLSMNQFNPEVKSGIGVEFFTLTGEKPGKAIGQVKEVTASTIKVAIGKQVLEVPKAAVLRTIHVEGATIDEVLEYLKKAYGNDDYVNLFNVK